MEILQLGAQYGFPAALTCFLLWTQTQRDIRRDASTTAAQTFTQTTLVELVRASTTAITTNATAVTNLAACLTRSAEATHDTAEKLDQLAFLFHSHACPYAQLTHPPEPPEPAAAPHILREAE